MNIDPLAENSRRYSPFAYALNNPVFYIDPDGMEAQATNGMDTLDVDDFDDEVDMGYGRKMDASKVAGAVNYSGNPKLNKKGEQKVVNNILQAQVSQNYDNPGGRAEVSDETLYDMKDRIPLLRSVYREAGSPIMESNKKPMANDGAEAKTYLNESNMRGSYITFFASSFTSYSNLAENMLHELGHAVFNLQGCYDGLIKEYPKHSRYPLGYSEVFAFKFAYARGGVPYKEHPWFLINYRYFQKAESQKK